MKRIYSVILIIVLLFGCFTFASCKKDDSYDVMFTWEETSYTDTILSTTNNEQYDYDSLYVQPVEMLRDDFLMGVDASMIDKVEECGGKYYNKLGQEQDVFEILQQNGVNCLRVRVWVNPFDRYGNGYGGGDCNTAAAIRMAKRAQRVGMKIMVDFHYSDFWADPDTQETPREWATLSKTELIAKVEEYTQSQLTLFKNAGVTVDIVQIGNEINNGILEPTGEINWNDPDDSFDFIASVLSSGIKGSKAVFPNVYTVIHLANGGNYDEFNTYFENLEQRKVDYDIIGASYYPYYHGTLQQLQDNLDNISDKFDKPVIVAETAYGFTDDYNEYTNNSYSSSDEDVGKYLTSIQGQATAIRDVINVLANVPAHLGLGVFYWEPAWLPVEGASWATLQSGRVTGSDGLATWSNQALFSYQGRMLPSLQVFNLVRGEQTPVVEVSTKLRYETVSYTLNIAENEQLPDTVAVETNYDAIRQMAVVWNSTQILQLSAVGSYVVTGVVDGQYNVTANVEVIENFVVDPGYEKQGSTDNIISPWIIAESTPDGEKVVKLDRKTDTRTGTTDLNWYHGSENFSFTVKQDITGLEAGTYQLGVYCMALQEGTNTLYIYIKYNDGQTETYDLLPYIMGWGSKDTYYVHAVIDNILITLPNCEIGIVCDADATTWGHLDDWTLVRTD